MDELGSSVEHVVLLAIELLRRWRESTVGCASHEAENRDISLLVKPADIDRNRMLKRNRHYSTTQSVRCSPSCTSFSARSVPVTIL